MPPTRQAGSVNAEGTGGYIDTWLFLGMTARQRGKHDEAIARLARFEAWHGEQKFDNWQERVRWSTLVAEARKLIHTPPPMRKLAPGE